MFKRFVKLLIQPRLSKEAFDAYIDRLPLSIDVRWKRDGRYIVGKIVDGDNIYFTQGINADNFVEMVNDAIYTYHEIPEDYRRIISQLRAYRPNLEQEGLLKNQEVKGSRVSIKRERLDFANA